LRGAGDGLMVTPRELKAELDDGSPIQLVDVRNPLEWDLCHISGAHLIPEKQLSSRITELDPGLRTVVCCRTGIRSARALGVFRRAGFKDVRNLLGGIHAWADDVDPEVPKY